MRNTRMLFLVSLLLVLGLTACGGGTQNGTAGTNDGPVSGDTAGTNGTNGYTGGVNGSNGTNGSVTDGGVNGSDRANDSLMDDARDALDDAGNAVGRAMDGF